MNLFSIDFLGGGGGFFWESECFTSVGSTLRRRHSVAFNIALVRFDFFAFWWGVFGNLTFCSLLPSHCFPICSTLCLSTYVSMEHLSFKGFSLKHCLGQKGGFIFCP